MPTWNAGPLLDEVLAAVRAQASPAFDELVAIDSGSTDGTVERLLGAGFRVAGIPQREFDHGGTRGAFRASVLLELGVLALLDALAFRRPRAVAAR